MTKLRSFLGIALAAALVLCGAAAYTSFAKYATIPSANQDTLYQVSTFDALMHGIYDSNVTIGNLKAHGDFGIGAFEGMDGEMMVLDGQVWQSKTDGSVSLASDNQTTPFAMITHFDSSILQETPGNAMNFSEFKAEMAHRLPSQNMIYAVKIHGTFPSVTVRAIPAQEKPYPLLTDAVRQQKIFTYTNISGTLVGFYMPAIYKDLNIVGYHLHFISDDHTRGSHVLDVTLAPGTTVQYDQKPDLTVALPASGPFASTDFSADTYSGDMATGD